MCVCVCMCVCGGACVCVCDDPAVESRVRVVRRGRADVLVLVAHEHHHGTCSPHVLGAQDVLAVLSHLLKAVALCKRTTDTNISRACHRNRRTSSCRRCTRGTCTICGGRARSLWRVWRRQLDLLLLGRRSGIFPHPLRHQEAQRPHRPMRPSGGDSDDD
jgi:hypothetical protein